MDLVFKVVNSLSGLDVSSPLVSGILKSNDNQRNKLIRIAEGILDEGKFLEIKDAIDFLKDEEINQLLGNGEIGDNDDSEYQEEFIIGKKEIDILEKASEQVFDPTRLLTLEEKEILPDEFKKQFDIDDIEEWDIIIIGKLYDLDRIASKNKIIELIGDEEDLDKIKVLIDDAVYNMITIDNGYFVNEDKNDENSNKLSYQEFYERGGYSEKDARYESIKYVRRKIMADFDQESRETEFAFNKLDLENGDVNRDEYEVEFDGCQIVPKRRVQYKYAVSLDGPQPLQIEYNSSLVPIRTYTPFDINRCENTLKLLDEEVAKSGKDSRLDMEIAYYEFKLVEAEFLSRFPEFGGVKVSNIDEWSNELLSEPDVREIIENLSKEVTDIIERVFGTIEVARSRKNTGKFLEQHYIAELGLVKLAYNEFKLKETIRNSELENIKGFN